RKDLPVKVADEVDRQQQDQGGASAGRGTRLGRHYSSGGGSVPPSTHANSRPGETRFTSVDRRLAPCRLSGDGRQGTRRCRRRGSGQNTTRTPSEGSTRRRSSR